MAWKVDLDKERGFIHSIFSGAVTKDEVLAATAETLNLSVGKGPQKYFTEWIDATSTLSTMEIFVIPSEWEAAGISRGSVLALVIEKKVRIGRTPCSTKTPVGIAAGGSAYSRIEVMPSNGWKSRKSWEQEKRRL